VSSSECRKKSGVEVELAIGSASAGDGGARLLTTGLEGGVSWVLSSYLLYRVPLEYEGNAMPSSSDSSSDSSSSSNRVSRERLLEGVEWNEDVCEELSEPPRRSECE
jgi:hypothetical protein